MKAALHRNKLQGQRYHYAEAPQHDLVRYSCCIVCFVNRDIQRKQIL